MSKEAEILKTGLSCHDTLLPKIKQIKVGGGGGGVMYLRLYLSVLQKLTLKLSDYGQSYLFN